MTVRTYRQSAVKRFKRCRRSYDLGYRQNLTLKYESPSVATVGTIVHKGLQAYYLHQDPLAAIALDRLATPQAAIDPELGKMYDLARIMVEGYIEWQADNGYDQSWEVLAVEQQLELPIGTIEGDQVTLTGQLDLLVRDGNGDVYVIDDKTCATFDKYTFNIQMSEQLLFYDMLVRRTMNTEPAGAIYNMLKRVKRTGTAKPPFFRREVVRFNSTQRTNYETQVLGIVADMVRADQAVEADPDAHQSAMYPNPTGDCQWDCSFLAVCPMRDTGDHFADALEDMYQVRLPDPERKPNAA